MFTEVYKFKLAFIFAIKFFAKKIPSYFYLYKIYLIMSSNNFVLAFHLPIINIF